ncbi:hypothetical protein [Fodinicola feengrottensis]|uniref:Secreted protein n=1 Tax=Fodinicola feengrottensis TaxID=435914 RepID=A0ABN2HSH9_9ACTN|nr:hypothetical protein [Fodinicola feengrottensis]
MRKILAACLVAGSVFALATATASPAEAATYSPQGSLPCREYNDAHGSALAGKCWDLPAPNTVFRIQVDCTDGAVEDGNWAPAYSWSEAYCSGTATVTGHWYETM